MVVSGLPVRNGIKHAGEIASMALHLLRRISRFELPHKPGESLKIRIGIHSGKYKMGFRIVSVEINPRSNPIYRPLRGWCCGAKNAEILPLRGHCEHRVENGVLRVTAQDSHVRAHLETVTKAWRLSGRRTGSREDQGTMALKFRVKFRRISVI